MNCKACGTRNSNPILTPVIMPTPPNIWCSPIEEMTTEMLCRWACHKCGRFHFRDGELYGFEEAKIKAGITTKKKPAVI